MKSLQRNFIIFCSVMLGSTTSLVYAQSAFDYEMRTFRQVGLTSSNATFLTSTDVDNIGEASLFYKGEKGDFKHPLLAQKKNFGGFAADRYQRVGQWSMYGRFDLTFGQDQKVSNATQINPLRLNPYIISDSLSGDWNKQFYDISGKIAAPLGSDQFALGFGFTYKASTGARQRDPRPENTSNELGVSPSLSWNLNAQNTIGLNGIYQNFVEDFSVQNVNTTSVHNMYKLIGVGEYISSSPIFISTGGINRRYTGNEFGLGLQYMFKGNHMEFFAEGEYRVRTENAVDGTTFPQQAGKHEYDQIGLTAELSVRTEGLIHKLQGNWKQFDIANTEFHQYQDPTTREYITLFSEQFNTNLVTYAALLYDLMGVTHENPNWKLGVAATYSGWDNKYALNQSQQTVDRLSYGFTFAKYVNFRDESALKIQINPGYSKALETIFQYSEKSYSTNYVASNILFPTNSYMGSDFWTLDASLQYHFKKFDKRNAQAYLKIGEQFAQQAGHTGAPHFQKGANRMLWQLSLRITTF